MEQLGDATSGSESGGGDGSMTENARRADEETGRLEARARTRQIALTT